MSNLSCLVSDELGGFWEWAEPLRQEINLALDRYSRFGAGCPPKLEEAIRYSLLAPGKRLRPLLVLLTTEACGSDYRRAMPAACAVEMVHTYSLIHDDLPAMDDDDLRRGRPTCHVQFGEALAILAGDALLARAFELLAAEVSPPHIAALCCQELSRAAGATALVGGQVDDLQAQHRPGDLDVLQSIHQRKTGALFQASMRLGALIGQADPDRLSSLSRYGQCIGMAFQIVDDLLDCGNASTCVGKRTGKDRTLGKLTFPALLGVEQSRQKVAELIAEAQAVVMPLGKPGKRLASLASFVMSRSH